MNMPQTAYVFPGQGSQCVGMGQGLAQSFEEARDTFVEADAALGFALSALCFGGPAPELTETRNAQPAILVTSIAAWRGPTGKAHRSAAAVLHGRSQPGRVQRPCGRGRTNFCRRRAVKRGCAAN